MQDCHSIRLRLLKLNIRARQDIQEIFAVTAWHAAIWPWAGLNMTVSITIYGLGKPAVDWANYPKSGQDQHEAGFELEWSQLQFSKNPWSSNWEKSICRISVEKPKDLRFKLRLPKLEKFFNFFSSYHSHRYYPLLQHAKPRCKTSIVTEIGADVMLMLWQGPRGHWCWKISAWVTASGYQPPGYPKQT